MELLIHEAIPSIYQSLQTNRGWVGGGVLCHPRHPSNTFVGSRSVCLAKQTVVSTIDFKSGYVCRMKQSKPPKEALVLERLFLHCWPCSYLTASTCEHQWVVLVAVRVLFTITQSCRLCYYIMCLVKLDNV